ncbi:iron complex transport system substrate-binding protein [Mumia flava]|uniref:Iron complex transport system substrate-binding protein n=1 Tax=Mumia flava TaxID=1348852 RepID=A0A0B2BLL7_9ACTN|nr:iron-siderophore ABC transporter substrate-binding protein [Mumia flava]PJJ57499.1 iron complex transport system substrate-binding protein [Mumia flava]
MKTTRTLATVASAAAALALAACGTTEEAGGDEDASSSEPITVTDVRGEEITLDGPATRVGVTEWNVAEYLVSLGVQPVGVSDISGFETWDTSVELGDDVTDLGTRGEPSIDTVASLDLDVLFVTDQLAGDAMKQIEETTPVVVVAGGDAADQIARMWDNVDLVAEVTGTTDEAADLRSDFDATLADAQQAISDAGAEGAAVAFSDAYDTGDAVSIRPFTETSLVGAVFSEIGLSSAWSEIPGIEGDPGYGLGATDVEGLTKLGDDTLYWYYTSESEGDVYTDALADNKVWTSLPFVEAGQVTRFPDGIWMFGGPASMTRLVEAAVDTVS